MSASAGADEDQAAHADADAARVAALAERLVTEHPPATTDVVTFLGAQFDLGLAWIHFAQGCGGLGLRPALQTIANDRLRAAGAPSAWDRNPIGIGMAAPTIAAHGSDSQKARYLRPLFTGEEVWCQLFSEPGAGSDVAALATRAERDGDEWVINGQKVWTSVAHRARWGMVLARTDPTAEKHKGLTYFVIDMRQPGVDIRPLRQMTGDAHFNEVYFTDARTPDSERLSDVGDGWRGALTTLMNERVSIGGSVAPRGSGAIGTAVRLYKERAVADPAVRDRLMQLWCAAECARLTNIRASNNRRRGTPGPEGSTGKLAFAELNKEIYSFCVDLLGAEGMLYDDYSVRRERESMFGGSVQRDFLRARANSIEGGTSEVMRNILGERVLGLPGDVRVDKGKSWLEVPRG